MEYTSINYYPTDRMVWYKLSHGGIKYTNIGYRYARAACAIASSLVPIPIPMLHAEKGEGLVDLVMSE